MRGRRTSTIIPRRPPAPRRGQARGERTTGEPREAFLAASNISPVGGMSVTSMSASALRGDGLETVQPCRTQLLAMVAHELNQPLTVIDASAQVLSRQEHGVGELSSTLLAETRRLRRLVQDLIDIAQLTTDGLQLQREPIDLVHVVRAEVAAAQLSSHGHHVHLVLGQEVVLGFCDADRIAQVLSNLLRNAIAYTSGGTIRVDLRVEGQEAWLSVCDSGPGIPADRLGTIFKPGVRLVASGPDAEPDGSGLGLYIVKGIVEAHGGRVWAESEPGAGAIFVVTLPLFDPELAA
jgi:signal transduction histidine kinase